MTWFTRRLHIVIALLFCLTLVDSAAAHRCFRLCRSRPKYCCCLPPYRLDNWTCYQARLYTLIPGLHVYDAIFHEGTCPASEPQSVYAIGGDELGEYPNQICDSEESPCFKEPVKRQKTSAGEIPTIPHHTGEVFAGHEPLPPEFVPEWAPSVTADEGAFFQIYLAQQGKTYKSKIFRVQSQSSASPLFVAFEIRDFPAGLPSPPPKLDFKAGEVKRCRGNHAYTMHHQDRGMLFFTAKRE